MARGGYGGCVCGAALVEEMRRDGARWGALWNEKGGMERSGVKKAGRGTTSLQMPYSRGGGFPLCGKSGCCAGGSGDLCGTSGGRYAGRGRNEGKPAVHFYFQ
ncbi:MAG: hypothetical protein ACLVLH_18150 [Eisenbergiella massiliensis]